MRVASFAVGLLLMCASSGVATASSAASVPLQAKDGGGESKKKRLTEAQIKKILIDESIAAYDGNCPCPYSTMRNGRSCGRRSAYSREGGEAPLCYAKDVTAVMVSEYRAANEEE
jgi:hypothetical protein